jgi:hypothetical protein
MIDFNGPLPQLLAQLASLISGELRSDIADRYLGLPVFSSQSFTRILLIKLGLGYAEKRSD